MDGMVALASVLLAALELGSERTAPFRFRARRTRVFFFLVFFLLTSYCSSPVRAFLRCFPSPDRRRLRALFTAIYARCTGAAEW